ncbi:MAG: hypothetical protein PUH38_06820 [Acidaminococcus fermentans]|uniref:hypothetical protein n=1 Tax=Acidaminococcus fermentans TaxID=905 RepID=UPI00242C9012|nr:hypothetical protein [Acidaminococcus fermentans]MDD7196161.1 hypothetical protein [Acidaminococcus fermentans]
MAWHNCKICNGCGQLGEVVFYEGQYLCKDCLWKALADVDERTPEEREWEAIKAMVTPKNLFFFSLIMTLIMTLLRVGGEFLIRLRLHLYGIPL